MAAVLELVDVTVRRGDSVLLDRVSWTVEEDERWVVLGPNGAGKTTLLQIASAQLFPTQGSVEVLEERLGSVDVFELRPRIGLTSAALADAVDEALSAQIEAMPQGGTYAMVAPPNPFRCPPGPYERISMVAHVLKEKNPTAKIIIADPKSKFSKMSLFQEGWANNYEGMVDWIGEDFGGGNVSVDAANMTLSIDEEEFAVDVCNVIPAMKAGRIADQAGVTDGNWAPVNPADMSSRMDPDVYVLGDSAQQGDMPKSGFSANSQAKVCANAVTGALLGTKVFPPRFLNTCWSLIAPNDGVKVGASYEATEEKIARVDGFISQPGESTDLRRATYEESEGWYAGMTADMFGGSGS